MLGLKLSRWGVHSGVVVGPFVVSLPHDGASVDCLAAGLQPCAAAGLLGAAQPVEAAYLFTRPR